MENCRVKASVVHTELYGINHHSKFLLENFYLIGDFVSTLEIHEGRENKIEKSAHNNSSSKYSSNHS